MERKMEFPKMLRIRQYFEAPTLNNIHNEVVSRIESVISSSTIREGQTVAIGCSSRGIKNYASIVKATTESLLQMNLKSFIFPAMGSHGAASSAGQKKVLENYGISEDTMGVPIKSSLDVVQIGKTEDHIPVYIDKFANAADHIVLINRIKHHTEFDSDIESGLMKMMAIGFGKKLGATIYHKAIMVHGYPKIIKSVARIVLQSEKVLFGVGIVENSLNQTSKIGVLRPHELEEKEKELLLEAKRLATRLPFEDIDVLIIDEMGKDISGTGFDTKVVGRILMPLVVSEPDTPRVKRIVVCDLTKDTEGNADGVGIADFVTQRLVDKIDLNALYINAIAGAEPEHAKIPLTLKNDQEAIEVAIGSVGIIPQEELKIMRIKNTMRLSEVEVSEAYRNEILKREDLEIVEEAKSMEFDKNGNLISF
jgi:hypothetical protein